MKVIETTLPLSPQNQIAYFKSKKPGEEPIQFLIDVEGSKLNIKQCLMMVSNMKLKVNFKKVTKELMKEYMTASFVVESDTLAKIYANIMTGATTGHMYYQDMDGVFSIDDVAEFIAENVEIIEKHAHVLNSIPLFLLINSENFLSDEKKEKVKSDLTYSKEKIDGVGVNISQAVSLPDFLDHYLKPQYVINMLQQPYYNYYFDEYIYGGDRLIRFLLSKQHQSEFAIKALNIMNYVKEGKTPYQVVEDTPSDS